MNASFKTYKENPRVSLKNVVPRTVFSFGKDGEKCVYETDTSLANT